MAPMFGAPAAHDLNAWNERKEIAFNRAFNGNVSISDKESFSINELVKSAISGTDKGMPPKGTCNDCTEEDLRSVIKFMISAN
jgi:cytochrome c5